MAVTAELLTKIKEYRSQGYTPDEIVQGLAQSTTFPDVAKKVKAYVKGRFSADDIIQGIQTSPIAKDDAAKLRSQFAAEEGGSDYTEQQRKKFVADTATPTTRIKEKAAEIGSSITDALPSRKGLADIARPVLEAGGAVAGGLVGSSGGPLTGVAGAGLGYAAGKNIADQIEGTTANQTPAQLTLSSLADIGTGATLEMGGQLVAKGGGYLLNKAAELRRALPTVTQSGIQAKAGRVIAENTGDAPIYAQNADEAAKLNIPGYQPSLGEARNDPGLIKLQRGIAADNGKASNIILERQAANQAAIKSHLGEQFPAPENIGNVVDSLKAKESAVAATTRQAENRAAAARASLNPADNQTVGRNVVEDIQDNIKPLKAAEREAWGKVPNYPIPTSNLTAAIDELSATPMVKSTESAVKEIMDYAKRMPKTTEGLQAIERTINDKMFAPNADPNVKRVLGNIKSALSEDFKLAGEAADTGDIAVFNGNVVYPSKLTQELTQIEGRIAEEQAKSASTPDIKAVVATLKEKGLPFMRITQEPEAAYAARMAKEYERVTGQQAPTLAGEPSPALANLTARKATINETLNNLKPAEDVAKAYRSAKDVSKERFDRFGKGAVAEITKTGNEITGLRIPDAQIPKRVFSPDGADDFIRAVGKEKAAVHADQYAAQDLLSKANPLTGEIPAKSVAQWIQKNSPVLRKYGISAKYGTVAKAQSQAEIARAAEVDFTKSAASRILNSDVDKAMTSAFSSNPSNTGAVVDDLLKAVGNDQQGVRGLQNAFKDFLVTQAETSAKTISGDSVISPAAIQKVMAKYAPAMRRLYANEPGKIAALQRVAKAVEIQSRSAKPPTGGPGTSENLNMARSILGKVVDAVPGMGWPAKLGRMGLAKLNELNAKELNEVIARALYDPELAQTLTLAAKRHRPEVVEKRINSQLVTAGIIAVKNALQQ